MGIGMHRISAYLILNVSSNTQYCLIFTQRATRWPIYIKIPSEWYNFGVIGNMGSLYFKTGLSIIQSDYLNVNGLRPWICLFYYHILSNIGRIFIIIILARQCHRINRSLWVHIFQHNHDIIVVYLCEMISTNNSSHTGNHITTPVTSWKYARAIPPRSPPLYEIPYKIILM